MIIYQCCATINKHRVKNLTYGKNWIIMIAILIFITINFLYDKSMDGYVKKAFGKNVKYLRR